MRIVPPLRASNGFAATSWAPSKTVAAASDPGSCGFTWLIGTAYRLCPDRVVPRSRCLAAPSGDRTEALPRVNVRIPDPCTEVILDMSNRARRISAIIAPAMAVALVPGSGFAADTIRVHQTDLGSNWHLETLADRTGELVTGPATPPSGAGSFRMTTTVTNVDKSTLMTTDWTGHLLSDLSAMDYWTYRDGSSTSPSYVAPSIN